MTPTTKTAEEILEKHWRKFLLDSYDKETSESADKNDILHDYILAAMTEYANLKSGEQWVSVSERMPKPQQRVIIEGGMGFHLSGLWYSIVDEGNKNPRPITWTVTHWRELPSPPKQ